MHQEKLYLRRAVFVSPRVGHSGFISYCSLCDLGVFYFYVLFSFVSPSHTWSSHSQFCAEESLLALFGGTICGAED